MSKINYKLFGSVVVLEIQAASSKHPNAMKFSGVLVRLDEPSTKAPHGSHGHKILIPKELAASKLKTLIGMPVNYHEELDRHQPDRPVGVIKAAKIKGNNVIISGIIWKKSFPSSVKDLSGSALGMSFEASEISVEDQEATVWRLSNLCFTGATILYKDKAAYKNTSATAMAAASSNINANQKLRMVAQGDNVMTPEEIKAKKLKEKKAKQKLEAQAATQNTLVTALTTVLAPLVSAIQTNNEKVDALAASIEAAKKKEKDDASKSKKKMDDPDEDDQDDEEDDEDEDDEDDVEAMDDEDDDDDDLEDLSDDDEDDDEDVVVGALNKKQTVANKGRTVPTKKVGKPLRGKPNDASASAIVRQLRDSNNALRAQLQEKESALSAAAEKTDRRSIPTVSSIMASTLAKGNLTIADLINEDQKITVAELDKMSAAAGLTTVQSMAQKNEAHRLGILSED